jgi:hypothetical protein
MAEEAGPASWLVSAIGAGTLVKLTFFFLSFCGL